MVGGCSMLCAIRRVGYRWLYIRHNANYIISRGYMVSASVIKKKSLVPLYYTTHTYWAPFQSIGPMVVMGLKTFELSTRNNYMAYHPLKEKERGLPMRMCMDIQGVAPHAIMHMSTRASTLLEPKIRKKRCVSDSLITLFPCLILYLTPSLSFNSPLSSPLDNRVNSSSSNHARWMQ